MSLLTVTPFQKPDEFDPKAYLAEKRAEFDPVAYLREKRISDMAANTGKAESFGRGAMQGASLGFGPNLAAGYSAAQKQIERMPELKGVPDAELYATAMASPDEQIDERDKLREGNEAAKRAHGGFYTGGEVVGGVLPGAAATLATGGAAPLATGAAMGGLQGAGYSHATSAGGLARDAGLGAGLGLLSQYVGEGASGAIRGVGNLAKSKAAAAAGRAATQAEQEATGELQSVVGQYAGEAQKGHRLIENIDRLAPKMTPEQQAALAELERTGVLQHLREQLAGHALEAAPTQAATIAERRATMEAAQHALPQAIASRTEELSQPQFLKDAASLAKSYAEPLIAEAALGPGAGIVMGRTRAGKAIMTRVMRPGNQIALWNAIQGAASAPEAGGELGQLLRRAIRASAAGPQIEAAVAP